jgi:hypothetical protein
MECEPDAARTADGLRELVRSLEAMRKGEMFPDTMMDALRGNFGDRVVTRAADQIASEIGAACSSPVSSAPGRAACCCRPPLRSRRGPSTRQSRRHDLTPSSGARSDDGRAPLSGCQQMTGERALAQLAEKISKYSAQACEKPLRRYQLTLMPARPPTLSPGWLRLML